MKKSGKIMTLELNDAIVPHRVFCGKNIEQMPLLISGRDKNGQKVDIPRFPINVEGVVRMRLMSEKKDWKGETINTGDAFIYHPDGKFKVVLNARPLLQINPKSELVNGALVLPDGIYEKIEGEEFNLADLKSKGLIYEGLTCNEAKVHPILRSLVRNSSLLNRYCDVMFKEMKKTFNHYRAMDIDPDSCEEVPTLRSCTICNIYEGRSQILSSQVMISNLDFDMGLLVGVATDKNIVRKSLEQSLSY